MSMPRKKDDGSPNRAARKRRERDKQRHVSDIEVCRGAPVKGTGQPKGQKKT